MPQANQFGIPPDADPVEVAGYFSATDPDFAKASNNDKAAYMSHVTGRQISYVGGNPVDLQSGQGATKAAQSQAKEQTRSGTLRHMRSHGFPDYNGNLGAGAGEALEGYALATPAIGLAEGVASGTLAPTAAKIGRGLVGGATGMYLGSEGGSRLGSHFGTTGSEVGSLAGGAAGLLLGGGLAAGMERAPATGEIKPLPFGIQRFIPDWMVPKSPSDQAALDLREAIAEGRASKIPTRIPRSLSRLGGGLSNTERTALPDVIQVPEPRTGTPMTREGAMWSVKRGKLLPLAKSGQPGAMDVLQNLGVRPLVIPAGADIESPSLSGLSGQQLLPTTGSTAPIQKLGGGTSAVNLVSGEAPRTNPSQEMMSLAHDQSRLRSVLSDPRATAAEKAYARKVLGAQ